MLVTTQWPLERAAHLTSLVWVCVLWLPESLMDLSALCYIRFGFEMCRALVGFDSGMCRPTPPNSGLCRTWFGLESLSGRPTYARHMTDLRPTNHLPSVAELRPTHPRTLPDKTDTTPTHNRQTTDNLSGRDLSNMFERSLPDKFVCPNINRHQTDKTESIPTVNRSLPEFDAFCRFEVGFVSV